MDTIKVNAMTDIPEYCLPIPKVATFMGITPEALTHRVKNNINNIQVYVIKIIFNRTQKFRFFIKHTFLTECLQEDKSKLTQEETLEIETLYYKLLEKVEEELASENKSVATKKQLWGDMPLVDMILCAKIFKYHKAKGTTLTSYLKSNVRKSIQYLDFNNAAVGKIALEAMQAIDKEMI